MGQTLRSRSKSIGFANSVPLLLLALKTASATALKACSSDAFTFPDLFGAELQTITATALNGYKENMGYKPEAALIGSDGVSVCNVTVSYTHPGHDDLVSLQVWLPLSNYNGRFVGVGGGGWVAHEVGNDLMSALAYQGYAAATTNAGYEQDMMSTPESWLMKSPGNLDYPLLVNFAHRVLHELSVIGRHLVEQGYGKSPSFSYWHGCSTGGRQGLTIANKYPDDFDGILAACPAVDFSALLVALYWPQLCMNQLGVYPPACHLEAVVAAAVEACDELDGVDRKSVV